MKTMLYVALVVIWGSVVLAAINSSPTASGTTPTPTDPNGTLTDPGLTQPMTATNQPGASVGTNQNSWNSNLYWSTNKPPGNATPNQQNSAYKTNGFVPTWSNQTPPIVATNQLSSGQPIPMNQ